MRHVLPNYALARNAQKRERGRARVTLDDQAIGASADPELLNDIDNALGHVAAVAPSHGAERRQPSVERWAVLEIPDAETDGH